MPRECAAAECSEYHKKDSGLSFHVFPSDSRLKQEWVVKMNRLDTNTKKLWKAGQHDVLCSRHFEASCFTMRTRLSREEGIAYKAQLEPDAVPTIFRHCLEDPRKRGTLHADHTRPAYPRRRRKEVRMESDDQDETSLSEVKIEIDIAEETSPHFNAHGQVLAGSVGGELQHFNTTKVPKPSQCLYGNSSSVKSHPDESVCNRDPIAVQARKQRDTTTWLYSDKLYKCTECDFEARVPCGLRAHMKKHSREKPDCSESAAHFKSRNGLKAGVQIQRETNLYKCSQCGSAFRFHSELKIHIRQHKGQTPFKCTVCGDIFSESHILKVHMRRHTGERPYKCEKCEATFTTASAVKGHMRKHSDQRPYECLVCATKFKSPGALKIHIQKLHGEKPIGNSSETLVRKRPEKNKSAQSVLEDISKQSKCSKPQVVTQHKGTTYICSQCDFACRSLRILNGHTKTHLQEKLLRCSECAVICGSQRDMAAHAENHTREREKTQHHSFADSFPRVKTEDKNGHYGSVLSGDTQRSGASENLPGNTTPVKTEIVSEHFNHGSESSTESQNFSCSKAVVKTEDVSDQWDFDQNNETDSHYSSSSNGLREKTCACNHLNGGCNCIVKPPGELSKSVVVKLEVEDTGDPLDIVLKSEAGPTQTLDDTDQVCCNRQTHLPLMVKEEAQGNIACVEKSESTVKLETLSASGDEEVNGIMAF